MAGNRDRITGSDILTNQNIAFPGLQINHSLYRIDGISYSNTAVFCGNIYIPGHVHIRAKNNTSLFTYGGGKPLLRIKFIRNVDIAITPIEINSTAGFNQAILLDDEVAISCALYIHILSGFHADVTTRRNRMSLNGNRTRIGANADIFIRNKRFLIMHIIAANRNITLARFQLNAFIFGFYPFDNGNITLICANADIALSRYRFFIHFIYLANRDIPLSGNINRDIPGFSSKPTIQVDISVAIQNEVHIFASLQQSFALRLIGQARNSTDMDTAACTCRSSMPDFYINTIPRFHCANVVNRIFSQHEDIISGLNAFANPVDGAFASACQ